MMIYTQQHRQDQREVIDQMFTCGQKLTACLAELESYSESKLGAAEYKMRATLSMKKEYSKPTPKALQFNT